MMCSLQIAKICLLMISILMLLCPLLLLEVSLLLLYLVRKFDKYATRPSPFPTKPFIVPEHMDPHKLQHAFEEQGHIKRQPSFGIADQLPRDNKMYNITETFNLKEERSLFQRFNLLSQIKNESTVKKLKTFLSKRPSDSKPSLISRTPSPQLPASYRTYVGSSVQESGALSSIKKRR